MAEGDAVKVCVRVRPLIQRENGEQTSLHWKAENASISQVDGTKSFNFDRVFHSHETTNQVYQEIAVPIIRSAAQGYNGTIFAYGQTASGKTYTMMGTEKSLGIIPQAVQEIFSIIHEVPGREFLLRVSYMEIYNETVTDLLCDDRKKKPLEIREDINRNVYVADLTEELVVVPEQVLTWIKKGEKNRHYGETKMNERSSRSHTIFRMIVESRDRTDSGNGENCEGAVMVSHLNLVDLAGSERASQTGAEGLRLKEGCNINRSLFILGQVIKKLSDGQAGGFINYRDSKLTRILQNSLGGNAKTVIICTVTPVSFDETLSTLQFASTAKHMRNTPHVNEVLDDQALLKRYRKEIMDLKKQLEDLEVSSEVRTQAMAKEEHLQLLAEIKLLQKERQDRIWNLTHIVVNSSQASNKDEKEKRKRRVTWAAGNIQKSFSSVSDLSISSTITPNFIKKAKMSNLSPLAEIDDSFCTEISDLEESSNVLDDVAPESDFRNVNQNNRRDNASLCQSMIDFTFEGRLCNRYQCQELSLQKSKEIEQKTTELENHLKKLISENEAEAEIRESLKKDIINLQTQLQLKEEEKNKIVKNFEQRVKDLEDQLQTKIETNEMSNELGEKYTTDDQKQLENGVLRTDVNVLPGTAHSTDNDGDQNKPIDKVLCALPDDWIEHRRMLEIKIMDLEQIIETSKLAHCNKNDTQKYSEQDLMESIQICEVLMNENGNAVEELAVMRNSFDSIVLENESLKREIADLENQLREKEATNEFEVLERESLKEHETQLTHEIVNLKNLIGNAEVHNQDLEAQLESKSRLLKEQEKQLVELKKNADDLQKKVRNMELSVSMGDGERLCEEVFQMRQSVSDAERVTLDAKRESAFLRSENLQLKEKMEEFSIRHEQMEKEISIYEKQIETEKTKYKQMQTDLQKELQYAFNEINQLNGLMVGKVPKDLLLRVELEKKIGDCTKQLEKAMEEKNDLEKEVTYLSEFKSLPSEVERLKNEMHDTTEELNAVKTEREQSVIVLSSLETRLQEQSKQIELLTEDLTRAQAKLQNAEEQSKQIELLTEDLTQAQAKLQNAEEQSKQIELLTEDLTQAQAKLQNAEEQSKQIELLTEDLTQAQAKLQNAEEQSKQIELLTEDLTQAQAKLQNAEEQSKQIELLTEDLTQAQAKLQNAEEQYSELKQLHDFLQEKSTLTTEELMHRQAQCESLLKEVEQLKGLVETLEEKLATKIQELEEAITVKEQLLLEQELAQEKQMAVSDVEQLCEQLKITKTALFTMEEERNQVNLQLQALQEELTRLNKEREEIQKSVEEMDKIKEQVYNLSSLVEDLQEEASKLAQVQKEKEQLEECIQQCHHEKDQLQDCVKEMQCSLDIMQLEKLEVDQKLNELQDELKVIVQERNELQHTWEDLKTERDNLKQDLNENIELSIQNQEELRAKQDELKQQAQIVNDLKKQIAEYLSTSLQAENKDNVDEKILLQENLQENERLYQKLEEERKALEKDCEGLKSEMEHLHECRKATELTLEKLNEEKADLTHKLCTAEEQLRFVSHERDTIKEMQESFRDERDKLLEEVQKNVKKIQQLTEEVNLYSERNTLHDEDGKVQHLHQKILAAVKEKEELQEILETVRAERDQLKLDLQENIEMSIETQEELRCALDELKKKKQLLDAMEDKESDNYLMPREDLEHKICQLEEQLNTMTSEKDKLLHELNIMTGEKQELEDLVSSFTVDRDADVNETKNNLQEELQSPLEEVKQDCEKYAAQLEEERTINNNLYSQIEEKNKTIEEQESQLKNISENLCEADSKYTRLMESLELVTREKDQLLQTLESTAAANVTVPNDSNEYKQVTETTHQSLQTSLVISMESDADESILTSATRIEDKESKQNLNESVNQLKKQLYFVSQEKEELQGLIDHLKLENQQLMIMTDQLKSTEKEVTLSLQNQLNSSYEALVNEVETLKDKLNVTETNLELKEREAVELKQTDYKIGSNTIEGSEEINNFLEPSTSHAESERSPYVYYPEIKVLEENLQVTQALLEAIKGEKLELENKLHTLQEEVFCLKHELQQKHARTEQLTDGHKQVQYELTFKMDALTETKKHSECLLEALQQEKLEAQEKLLDLQQQIQTLTQERDELKNTQERMVTESHELNEDLKETVSMFTETKTEWRMQDELKCQAKLMDDFKIQDSSMPTEIEQSLEEKVLHLQKELEQKTAEEKQLINKHEEAQHELKSMVDELTETIKHHQSVLEALQGEKLEAQQTLLDFQQEMQTLKEERDALKNTQERLMAESDQLKVQHDLQSKVDALMETMKHSELLLEALQGEKLEAHQKLLDLQQQMETVTQDRDELLNTQKGLMSESDHLKEELKDSVSKYTETQDELRKTQEELLCQKQLIDHLKSQNSLRPTEEVVQSLEEKVLHLENELEQKAAEDQHMKDQYEQAQHELKSKMNALMETLKHSESVLETLQDEKLEAQQKLLDLQQQMQTATQEKDELQSTKEKLREESDQLKEDLKDKISMYLKIEDELKSTQNELKYQKDLLDDLRVQVSSRPTTEIVQSLKDKILHLRNELQQKEAEEQELLDKNEKAQNELRLKVDELTETMKHSQSVLEVVQGEKLEAQQKLFDLQEQVGTVTQERDELHNKQERVIAESNQLKEDLKENISMSIEIQDELRSAHEESQKQKLREQDLNNQISLLEQKLSAQEKEMLHIGTSLKETISANEVLTQCKEQLASELEQLNQSLKDKAIALEQLESEKMEVAKKLLNLTEDMRTISEERDRLKHLKDTMHTEAKNLHDDLQQLQHQYDLLSDEQKRGIAKLEEMINENKHLKENISVSDASIEKLEVEKVLLEKHIQEYEMKVASLHQEREQHQQLLERIRGEKDNIYMDLQAQENISKQLREELNDCQTELQSVKQQKNAINETLEKTSQLDDQISSLQQKLKNVNQELLAEKIKNCDLCEKVGLMEKEIQVLRSLQDESLQEDDLADRMEFLENKNEELKELMGKVSEIYSDHNNLVNNVSGELQNNIETQKQSMCIIKESLSSTMSRAFGNLQTENIKLNSQLQTLLNKLKVVCRNAEVKDEYYSLIKDFEKDLCAEQKKLDELQYLEEHGTKCSGAALEELKICELEYLNKLIFTKMELMKRVEGDFSDMLVTFKSMASELQKEVTCKQEFLLWLEDFKTLHLDAVKLNEGVQKENKRISAVVLNLTKNLKAVAQSKIKNYITTYVNQLDTDLRETKSKSKEQLASMKHLPASGNTSALEEENAALLTKLRSVEAELKKTKSRIRNLENELESAKARIQQKEEKVALLQNQLLSRTAETELAKVQVKLTEKENALHTVLEEVKSLQEKVAQGARPYKEDIDNLKTQLVKIEMEKMKLSKSMDAEIESLKARLEDKTESVRKLREQLRKTQQDHDSTVIVEKDHSSSSKLPLTCGGGSGIVQSTAMLVLQSEKASLERELAQYKRKCERFSRNMSHLEDELTKWKDKATRAQSSPSKSEIHKEHAVSPTRCVPYLQSHRSVSPIKGELHKRCPGTNMAELHRKRPASPSKAELLRKCPSSPNKVELFRKRPGSPSKAETKRQCGLSPRKTDIPLLTTLTASPSKAKDLQEHIDSPKSTFFDSRSRSLPVHYPTQFFDNSSLGTFSESRPSETTEPNEEENWWYAPNKAENAPGCKTS